MKKEEDDVPYLFRVLATCPRLRKCHQLFQHVCQHEQRTLSEKHSSEYNAKKAEILIRNGGGGVVELLFEFHDIKLWGK
jgi:ribosomal protein RSM22 (predicted rRNA methylase)